MFCTPLKHEFVLDREGDQEGSTGQHQTMKRGGAKIKGGPK